MFYCFVMLCFSIVCMATSRGGLDYSPSSSNARCEADNSLMQGGPRVRHIFWRVVGFLRGSR